MRTFRPERYDLTLQAKGLRTILNLTFIHFTSSMDVSMRLPMAQPRGYSGPGEAATELSLAQVGLSEEVELVRIDMPVEEMEPLLERGILPGCRICPVRFSPSGDPVVLVDGVLLALRKETAGCLCVKRTDAEEAA